jgi:hypothetical protein
MRTYAVIAFVLCDWILSTPSTAATLYVTTSGSGNCSSWAQACTLPTALTGAASGDQIWVKTGTYAPFELPNGVKVIGGFAGTETAASQSDPSQHVTIVNGGGARAVSSSDTGPTTILRGFRITGGLATDFDGGGGVLLVNSSAMFVRCTFDNNNATFFGGAVTIQGGTPQFIACIFHSNGSGSGNAVTPYGGGAVSVYAGSPVFTDCLFYNNRAGDGGAVFVDLGAPTLNDCTIADNDALNGTGGGIYDQAAAGVVRNSIIWGNAASFGGDQIDSSATSVSYSDVEGGWTGTGNISSDPLFVSAGTGDYQLSTSSPCKNTGSNTLVPLDVGDLDWDLNTTETLPKDLTPRGRIIQTTVDMGAYEALIGNDG